MSARGWRAERWSIHAATTVLADAPTLTGKRVVAECAHENEAQLIAAAPELLAACKAVLASDEAAIRQLRAIGCNTVGDQRITGMLRAAIAKAEDGLTPEQVAALSVEVES